MLCTLAFCKAVYTLTFWRVIHSAWKSYLKKNTKKNIKNKKNWYFAQFSAKMDVLVTHKNYLFEAIVMDIFILWRNKKNNYLDLSSIWGNGDEKI